MIRAIALIVAAGRGSRAGNGGPKQYRPLAGRAVLARTVEAFLKHPKIDAVRVVIHRDDDDLYATAMAGLLANPKLMRPVHGGAERQDSARLGLESLKADAPRLALIHDAARPFVDQGTIGRVIDALEAAPGAIAALPVHDTIKRAADDGATIEGTVERTRLWRAQTPQGFHFDAILSAHRAAAGQSLTDDAAVAEAAGVAVALVPGSPDNMKITQAEDFGMAELLLGRRKTMVEFRTGQGFDVHQFEPGDAVILCGVAIPHPAKLKGHSDADAAMHALTDAILGAIGEGDIGDHFPPTDPQWRGAPSRIFLEKACAFVREKGGDVAHCDITIICEAPKIKPHRLAMREALAAIMALPIDRISVKATTTEELGFTGRREGVAALAAATVRLPDRD
ncbi:MAG: bifunctional 2-C-methyl-D-erythritol 4-phosphate cytidylyltransferase/2-C-methyl-D-erythritol 2,4-cyclodiphosphate synthase [Parvularculaceae bacterium]